MSETRSPLPTGIVLLLTMTVSRRRCWAMERAAASTYDMSAPKPPATVGVLTAMKMNSAPPTASA